MLVGFVSSGCGAAPSDEAPSLSDCGIDHEDCATSLLVKGGTFSRRFDGVSFTDPQFIATVSDFKLDKFEVTVGRFRVFLDDVVDKNWSPAAGEGKLR